MIGACGWALLQQGQQFEQGVPGESCEAVRRGRGWLGRRDGDAQPQGAPIGHHDVAGALGRVAHRQTGSVGRRGGGWGRSPRSLQDRAEVGSGRGHHVAR